MASSGHSPGEELPLAINKLRLASRVQGAQPARAGRADSSS